MTLLDSNKKGGRPPEWRLPLRLILCLALLFLFSCEDDSNLGLGFDPDDENIRIFEKEFVLPTAVVLLDSVNSTRASRFLVGKYQHDELGMVRATSYNNFSLGTGAIPDNIVYDSTVLILENTYWYGAGNPQNIPHTILVHVLQDTLGSDFRYSDEQMPYESTPIGMRTYRADPEASDDDEEEEENNLVRIRIDDALGEDLLDKLQNEADEVSTNAKFQEYFKGIAIVSDESNVFMHGYTTLETDFSIYYHVNGDTTVRQYSFTLDAANQFNGIYADRSGTALAGLTVPREDFDPENERFYIQAGAGIVSKVNFAPFIEFMEQTADNVVINRAELSISLDLPGEFTPSPSGLVPYLVKEDNKRIIVRDQFGNVSFKALNDEIAQDNLVLRPDTVDNHIEYKGVITVYTESLLDTSIEQNILLFPDQLSTSINHLTTDTSRIKLKIHYTTLK